MPNIRSQILTDGLVELLIQLIHKMQMSAEISITKKITSEIKRVNGKFDILYLLSSTALAHPEGIIQEKIYPQVGQETLHDLTQELQYKGKIIEKNGSIKVSPSEPQTEPKNIKALQRAINQRWSTINLLDILKEADLRIGFTQQFHTVSSRESIDKNELHQYADNPRGTIRSSLEK